MIAQLRRAALVLLVFTILTGVAYPLLLTGIAQALFHDRANASLIVRDEMPRGSELIGQPFDDPKYFWGRPSATAPFAYNAEASSGSNLAVGNPDQVKAIAERVARLRAADPENREPVPADLVTASGSGLDPHISPGAARYQAGRIARIRGMNAAALAQLVDRCTSPRQAGILGEPRVNVLMLNLSLDHPEWWSAANPKLY